MAVSKNIADFRAVVKTNLLGSAEKLQQADLNVLITTAVKEIYSKDKPDNDVGDITGDGTYTYSMPTGWIEDFSVIVSIEYPAGDQEPNMMDERDWMIYEDTTGQKLRFLADTPTASETIRVTFTKPYKFSSNAVTIPDTDFDAICSCATSLALEALANEAASGTDSTINADVSGRSGSVAEYKDLARDYWIRYCNAIGRDPDNKPKAAYATKNFDTTFSWFGDYQTHPKRYR